MGQVAICGYNYHGCSELIASQTNGCESGKTISKIKGGVKGHWILSVRAQLWLRIMRLWGR
jgi:hypothetical protein